jgi:hypothetical protein
MAAGSKGGDRSGEQLLGDLLKKQRAALQLLQYGTETLQHNMDNVLPLGLSRQQLANALRQSWTLLTLKPEHMAKLEAVLQQELGADRQLWVKVLHRAARAASCSEATLRQRAQALMMVSVAGVGLNCHVWSVSIEGLHQAMATHSADAAAAGVWQEGGSQDGGQSTSAAGHWDNCVAPGPGCVAAVWRG